MRPWEDDVTESWVEENRPICPISHANPEAPIYCHNDCPWWIHGLGKDRRQECAIARIARLMP